MRLSDSALGGAATSCWGLFLPWSTWNTGRCMQPTVGYQVSPWPRPLPFVMVNEWSAWLHFLIPFPPRLCWGPIPPTVRCHFFNPFFHSHEVWAIMRSHIPLFYGLHATVPHLYHQLPTLHPHTHLSCPGKPAPPLLLWKAMKSVVFQKHKFINEKINIKSTI